jgi:hypothetical protein
MAIEAFWRNEVAGTMVNLGYRSRTQNNRISKDEAMPL